MAQIVNGLLNARIEIYMKPLSYQVGAFYANKRKEEIYNDNLHECGYCIGRILALYSG
ncbi:hypothetical protein GCM10028817_24860 [Spirosoma pomorum]